MVELGSLRHLGMRVCESSTFRLVVVLLIAANTITLAIDHPFASKDTARRLEICNYVFTGLFLAEMLLKL